MHRYAYDGLTRLLTVVERRDHDVTMKSDVRDVEIEINTEDKESEETKKDGDMRLINSKLNMGQDHTLDTTFRR